MLAVPASRATTPRRPRIGVVKFASCDGCQLTLLDCEDELLALADHVDIASFAEAVPLRAEAQPWARSDAMRSAPRSAARRSRSADPVTRTASAELPATPSSATAKRTSATSTSAMVKPAPLPCLAVVRSAGMRAC